MAETSHEHRCPTCGAPAPRLLATRAVRCGYCHAKLVPGEGGWKPAPADADDEPLRHTTARRLWLGGHRYALLGRLGRGEGSDVFLAERDGRLTERVVLKILRHGADRDLLEREHAMLETIEKSTAQGGPHFARLLPQRVAIGVGRLGRHGDEGERHVAAHRWRSGFVHTADDVMAAYPQGIGPDHAVWIWKRMLELLGWLHASGFVHGAVLPPHVLVHARDHGVVLTGWSRVTRAGEILPAQSDGLDPYYPDDLAAGRPTRPAQDVAMSARVVSKLLGGSHEKLPETVPAPIREIVEANLSTGDADAWALKERVQAAANRVFGPPRYVRFEMPGWG